MGTLLPAGYDSVTGKFRKYVSGDVISGALGGSLTAGRIPFASGSATLTDSSNLTWNDTTKQLKVTATTYPTIVVANSTLTSGFEFSMDNSRAYVWCYEPIGMLISTDNSGGGILISNNTDSSSVSGRVRLKSSAGSHIPLAVQGTGTQTGNLLNFLSSGSTVLSYFDASGYLTLPGDPTTANMAANKSYVDSAVTAPLISVTQSAHGFAVKDVIRHNGTSWTKAQGNTITNATDVWVVITVPDSNNFTALKQGRVTIASHGLTAGSLYYLSSSSAGAITTTKPVGDPSTPLGFFLPVIYVESSSVIHVLGTPYPEINPLYAEKVFTGTATSQTFSNIDLNAIGGELNFTITGQTNTTGDQTMLSMTINGNSGSNYESSILYTSGSTPGSSDSSSQTSIRLATGNASASGQTAYANGKVYKNLSGANNGEIVVDGHFQTNTLTTKRRGSFFGIYSNSANNVTSLTFTSPQFATNNHIRLFRNVY